MSSSSASVVIDGRPIEDLKVVELRKELEQRNLPKSGNKKELYDRLRNYLLSSGESARLESPSSSPQQKEAVAASDEAPINPYVKQYLANQQQALAEAQLNAELIRGTSSSDGDYEVASTDDSPTKELAAEQNRSTATQPPTEPWPSTTAPAKSQRAQTPPAIQGSMMEHVMEPPPEEPKNRAHTTEYVPLSAGIEKQEAKETGEENKSKKKKKEKKKGAPSDEVAERVTEMKESMTVEEAAPEEPTATMTVGEDLDYGEGLDDESQAAEEEVSRDITETIDTGKQTRMERRETTVAKSITEEGGRGKNISHRPAEKKSLPASDQHSITPEGLVRRRDSSPARNSLSQYIAIRGLKRPFTQKQLISMLSTFGTLSEDEFWIDSIKSSCIAKFENEEQAKRARESLHNVVWPSASDSSLCVEYSDEGKLARRRAETDQKPIPSSLSTQTSTLTGNAMPLAGGGMGITVTVDNRTSLPSREVDIYHDVPQYNIDMRDGVIQAVDDISEERLPEPMVLERKRRVSAQSGDDSTQRSTPIAQRSLEELFLKTATKPHIYYMPLTEEEAEERAERKRQAAAIAPPPPPGPSRPQPDAERERDRERRDRGPYHGDRDGNQRNSGGGMRRSRSPVERTRYRGVDDSPPRRRR